MSWPFDLEHSVMLTICGLVTVATVCFNVALVGRQKREARWLQIREKYAAPAAARDFKAEARAVDVYDPVALEAFLDRWRGQLPPRAVRKLHFKFDPPQEHSEIAGARVYIHGPAAAVGQCTIVRTVGL